MQKMSAKCGLSKIYTNHCIRATGATVLSEAGYNPADVMSVTGHRSISSLAIYQQTSAKKKEAMSAALASTVQGRELMPYTP
jgi:integrase